MNIQAVYVVKGMTCGHCVSSVTEEVSRISTVRGVEVDLATGHVTVSSESALDTDEVTRAVSEAGYELTGRV